MQMIIPIAKLEKGKQVAETCVHFGFCTAVCPTYVLDGEENDSPRGRIALIKAMLKGDGKPDRATITHVDRCLSCLSCATTCAAGVDYRTLVDTAREYIEASGARSLSERISRQTLAYVMTSPRILSILLKAGKPLLGVTSRLPGIVGTLARLSEAPGAHALVRRRGMPVPSLADNAKPIRRVALLDGCAQSVMGKEINDAARRLFARLNVQVVESDAPNQCCGALHLHLGYEKKAAQCASHLVDEWYGKLLRQEIDAIVVTTSGCGSVIRHYRELFADDPVRLEQASWVEKACLDITQFLMELRLPDTDALRSGPHWGARVAYHDSCSLKHGQKVTTEPRSLLARVGFTVKDIAESHLCCGSAGTYNILQPAIAERLGQRKADNIAATQPDVVAAGNMGCLMQVSLYSATPIAHVVQLVDWALGGPAPQRLESFTPSDVTRTSSSDAAMWGQEAATTADATDSLW
jgi:glycolate oxidase iron-sulfur subunit